MTDIEGLVAEGKAHPAPAHKPSKLDTAVIMYTSGTTGAIFPRYFPPGQPTDP